MPEKEAGTDNSFERFALMSGLISNIANPQDNGQFLGNMMQLIQQNRMREMKGKQVASDIALNQIRGQLLQQQTRGAETEADVSQATSQARIQTDLDNAKKSALSLDLAQKTHQSEILFQNAQAKYAMTRAEVAEATKENKILSSDATARSTQALAAADVAKSKFVITEAKYKEKLMSIAADPTTDNNQRLNALNTLMLIDGKRTMQSSQLLTKPQIEAKFLNSPLGYKVTLGGTRKIDEGKNAGLNEAVFGAWDKIERSNVPEYIKKAQQDMLSSHYDFGPVDDGKGGLQIPVDKQEQSLQNDIKIASMYADINLNEMDILIDEIVSIHPEIFNLAPSQQNFPIRQQIEQPALFGKPAATMSVTGLVAQILKSSGSYSPEDITKMISLDIAELTGAFEDFHKIEQELVSGITPIEAERGARKRERKRETSTKGSEFTRAFNIISTKRP